MTHFLIAGLVIIGLGRLLNSIFFVISATTSYSVILLALVVTVSVDSFSGISVVVPLLESHSILSAALLFFRIAHGFSRSRTLPVSKWCPTIRLGTPLLLKCRSPMCMPLKGTWSLVSIRPCNSINPHWFTHPGMPTYTSGASPSPLILQHMSSYTSQTRPFPPKFREKGHPPPIYAASLFFL